VNIFVINGGAGDGGGALFRASDRFSDGRILGAREILSGILLPWLRLLAALSLPEATLEHGENRDMNDMARCVPEERVATHHVHLNQP
jgi:hypothetical protein